MPAMYIRSMPSFLAISATLYAALPKASDFANDIPIGGRSPCDVLNQAHEELIFARCLGNDCWYGRFPKSDECLDPSLTADKIELLALCIWSPCVAPP